jgi:THO complex subunit 2
MFCGTLYRKYNVDLNGILQYVVNQLKHGNNLDLILIKELIQKMASIESLEELSENQVLAYAGGEILRAEATHIGAQTASKSTKRSSQRLMKALMDTKLAFPMAILISQQKNACIYSMDLNHLKLIGGLVDQCQETLFQYIIFLRENLDWEAYDELFPSLKELCLDYQLEPDMAFFMIREQINHAIKKMPPPIIDTEPEINYWHHPCLKDIIESVPVLFSHQEWNGISPEFYMTFWHLSLSDIYVPQDQYKIAIEKQHTLITALNENKDTSSSVIAKRKKEIEHLNEIVQKLELEQASHQAHYEKIMLRLLNEKEQWFLNAKLRTEINNQLLQYCIFPRCSFSAPDAIYCAKWIRLMHDIGTVKFSSLSFYDRVRKSLGCCSYHSRPPSIYPLSTTCFI